MGEEIALVREVWKRAAAALTRGEEIGVDTHELFKPIIRKVVDGFAPGPPEVAVDSLPHTRARRFYVYLLFDYLGLPRYVGKGTGNRWLSHERRPSARNIEKNSFIKQTAGVLGKGPQIKVQENLTEEEAYALEVGIIKAIGRYTAGPLCNLTDGGDGFDSATARKAGAAQSPEQRSESARKAGAAQSPEQRSENA